MRKSDPDWLALAFAFCSIANTDYKTFNALEARLKNTPVGQLCKKYIQSNEHQFSEQAGILLTGTKQWDVYLGRMM